SARGWACGGETADASAVAAPAARPAHCGVCFPILEAISPAFLRARSQPDGCLRFRAYTASAVPAAAPPAAIPIHGFASSLAVSINSPARCLTRSQRLSRLRLYTRVAMPTPAPTAAASQATELAPPTFRTSVVSAMALS